MTTFHLTDSPEKERRVKLARRSVAEKLWDNDALSESLRKMVQKGKITGYAASGLMALAGVGMMFGSPFHGAGLLVGAVLVAGSAGRTRESRFDVIVSGIEELRLQLVKTE